MRRRDGERNLVIFGKERPFLREAKGPTALTRIICIDSVEDMLDNALLLVVGLFDKETVIGNSVDGTILSVNSGCYRE